MCVRSAPASIRHRSAWRCLPAVAICLLSSTTSAQPVFDVLTDSFTLTGINDDGTVLSGNWNGRAIRWTESMGIEVLGAYALDGVPPCDGIPPSSSSLGISGDGQVVVGFSKDDSERSTAQGLVCTDQRAAAFTSTGLIPLGPEVIIPDSNSSWLSTANATSFDGSLVVGSFHRVDGPFGSSTEAAFLTTGGVVTFGLGEGSSATGISADGSVVAGVAGGDPFYWNAVDGVTVITDAQGSPVLSPDGVAMAFNRYGSIHRRWLTTGGETLVRSCGGGFCPSATGISEAGATIVTIWPGGPNPPTGYIWQEEMGHVSLSSYLTSNGIDVAGWRLGTGKLMISGDGSTIVGTAIPPTGGSVLFRITNVPEPSTSTLLIAGSVSITLLERLRTRRRRVPAGLADC